MEKNNKILSEGAGTRAITQPVEINTRIGSNNVEVRGEGTRIVTTSSKPVHPPKD